MVEGYESDELASNSEDEKRIKKAKEAASRKRRLAENVQGKEPRTLVGYFVMLSGWICK